MKKINGSSAVLRIVAAFLLAPTVLLGCELELDDKDSRSVVAGFNATDLTISGQATSFEVNQEFSFGDGAVITAKYSDESTKTLSASDVSVSFFSETDKSYFTDFTNAKANDTVVVIAKYKSGSVTCEYQYEVSITNSVKSIALKSGDTLYSYSGDGTTYHVVETSTTKMTLTYTDDATSDVSISKATFSDVTETSATMSYNGVSATVELTAGKTLAELLEVGATTNSLLGAGVTANALIASGKDLYDTTNTASDWLGSADTGYLLNVAKVAASDYVVDDETYGKVIDAYAAQATTTAPDVTGAKIKASNPLSGTSATSVTLVARVKNAANQNGFDSLITFCGTTNFSSCAIMESGGVHANCAGYFDNVDNLWTDTDWHTVVVIMNASTYSFYIDGVEKASDVAITNGSSWANTYWGTTCTTMAVGAGFTLTDEEPLWAAGYVDDGAYISDVALFPKALSATEIAAMN